MRLTRTESDTNLHRLHCMEIVRGLFWEWGLVRNWGRVGSYGQLRTDWSETKAEAKDARFGSHMSKAKGDTNSARVCW